MIRERWTPANLRFTFVGLAGWYATYAAIRNLKGFVPFVNGNLYDDELARLDRAMFFGHQPAVVLHDLLGTTFSADILSFFYLGWIVALPLSLAAALVWVRRARVGSWWVTAVSVDWILGVLINFSLPTLGPVYERPGPFAALASTKTAALQQSMMDDRLQVLARSRHSAPGAEHRGIRLAARGDRCDGMHRRAPCGSASRQSSGPCVPSWSSR